MNAHDCGTLLLIAHGYKEIGGMFCRNLDSVTLISFLFFSFFKKEV